MLDLPRLRELAKAATPGPWRVDPSCAPDDPAWVGTNNVSIFQVFTDGDESREVVTAWTWDVDTSHIRNAEYIAALSPDVVLALIDEVERLSRMHIEMCCLCVETSAKEST